MKLQRLMVATVAVGVLATGSCLKPNARGVSYAATSRPAETSAPTTIIDAETSAPDTTAPPAPTTTARVHDPSMIGDIYDGANGADVGTIIFVHGGGFQSGSRDDALTFAGPLVGQVLRGWDVFSIDYRFAAYPGAVYDVADAINFVRSPEGAAAGLSSRRIVVAGHSAGAAIALDAVLSANEGPSGTFGALPAVDGWISIAGVLDFSVAGPADPHVAWQTNHDPAANPISHLDAGDPPGLVVHGARDLIAPPAHALLFIARARQVGQFTVPLIFTNDKNCWGHTPLCEAARPQLVQFLDAIAR